MTGRDPAGAPRLHPSWYATPVVRAMPERRVMYCIPSLVPGGAERVAVLLSNAAVERGYTVELVTATGGGFWSERLDARVSWRVLGHEGPFARGGTPKLWRAIRDFQPDIFHGFLNMGLYYGALLSRLTGVKLIVGNLDTVPSGIAFSKLEERVARFCVRRAAHVACAAGESVAQSFHTEWGIPREKLVVVPNAVECAAIPFRDAALRAATRRELGLVDDEVALLSVGRLSPEKGWEQLVTAAAEVAPRFPRARWLLAGEGALRPRLEEVIATHGLGERFRLLGIRSDLVRLLQAADLFVLSSHYESGPIALLEAMAAGLPAVSTRGGLAEGLVVPGQTGW